MANTAEEHAQAFARSARGRAGGVLPGRVDSDRIAGRLEEVISQRQVVPGEDLPSQRAAVRLLEGYISQLRALSGRQGANFDAVWRIRQDLGRAANWGREGPLSPVEGARRAIYAAFSDELDDAAPDHAVYLSGTGGGTGALTNSRGRDFFLEKIGRAHV